MEQTEAAKTTKKRGKKGGAKKGAVAKQSQLATMTDKRDQVLSRLAEKYEERRDARLAAFREELVAKSALEIKMKEKGLEVYRDGTGLVVELQAGKQKLKVRREDEGGEEF